MSEPRQRLSLGLEAEPPDVAQRVRLFRLLLASAAELRTRMDRELAAHGLTTQQAMLLYHLEAQAASPPTLKQLAAQLAMTHQNVKQIALVLERKGFLEIVVDAADARVRRLVLTAHHRRFWRERNPGDYASVVAWTAALVPREVDAVVDGLSKLHASLMATRAAAQAAAGPPAEPAG
jgi:DNA-binding MarR family transcriptional regulator